MVPFIIGLVASAFAIISAFRHNDTALLLFTLLACYNFLLAELLQIKDKLK